MDIQRQPMRAVSVIGILLLLAPSVAGAAPAVATNLPGVFTRLAVPPSFDATSAAPDDLEANGFPPRPDAKAAPRAFAAWRRAITSGAARVFPKLTRTEIKHRPRIPRGIKNGIDYSSNWSGFALVNGAAAYGSSSFYFVMSDFVVPRAEQANGACTGGWDYSSAWVGIDGYSSADVLQAGTEADAYCSGGSTSSYYSAWYEWYPDPEIDIGGLPISPGDDVFVEVWDTSSTAGGLYLVDYNTNQAVSLGFYAPPGASLIGNSAEWIEERPSVGGALSTLTNYVEDFFENDFSGDFLSDISTPGAPAAGTTIVPIVMLDDSGSAISNPGLLGTMALWVYDENSARTATSP